MKKIVLSALALSALTGSAMGYNGRIVYLGTDPGYHFFAYSDATKLVTNSVTWAGGSAAPKIAYVEEEAGFGGSLGSLLSGAGLAATQISAGALASTDLSGYDVLLVGASTNPSGTGLTAAATNVANFVNGGGGLVVEPNVFDAASWSWVPYADLIGHSGSINIGNESVSITDASHPVMAGLSAGGLSGWGYSVHSNFSSPGAAGFVELARDVSGGKAYIIAREIPAPASGALLGLGGLIALRRRR